MNEAIEVSKLGQGDHYFTVELPEHIRKDVDDTEADFRSHDWTFSWIGEFEKWTSGLFWYCWLKDPDHRCRRIIRLSIVGGGQLRVIHRFEEDVHLEAGEDKPGIFEVSDWRSYPPRGVSAQLLATAEVGGSLHRYPGTVQVTEPRENDATAVVFECAPQGLVDRIARTLDLSNDEENFYALLDGRGRCSICRKPLRDKVSKLVAVGPDCAKRYGIPHTLEAASKRLARRNELLGGQGSH